MLFPLADRMTTDWLFLLGIVTWTVFFALLAVARVVPPARVNARRGAIAAGIATLLLLSSGLVRLITVELPPHVVVVSDRIATVRFEPSISGSPHFEVKPGAFLRLVAEREDWAQVARSDGLRGWVERKSIEVL
jgi:hypothetical protein